MKNNKALNIFDFTQDALTEFLLEHGFSKFVSAQVFDWLYNKKVVDTDQWSNVSKKCKEFLKDNLELYLDDIFKVDKSENKELNRNEEGFLFDNISDDEMDNLFLFEGVR